MTGLYLNKAQFAAELEKCLQCKAKPCENACPVHCSPHDFIAAAKSGNVQLAAKLIDKQNPLGETCGLICPDKFCQQACLRRYLDAPIQIPAVQAEIMRQARENRLFGAIAAPEPNGKKIAVIGAGPAGIGAAFELIKNGFGVTVFERRSSVGGALNLIPSERLPQEITAYGWQRLMTSGALEMKFDFAVESYDLLLQYGFSAVVVAVGEQKSRTLGIVGEEFCIDYTKYLQNPKKYATVGNVAIIGGGAAAVDCAVTAVKQGAKHTEMFVRRSLSDMRITAKERKLLLENRVDISTMTRPVKIEKNSGETIIVHTCKTQFDAKGRLTDIPYTEIARGGFDYIILALGSIRDGEPCESENIYYAGDFIMGGSTAVEAIASGKKAAEAIVSKYG